MSVTQGELRKFKLRYTKDSDLSFSRKGAGKGFMYFSGNKQLIKDPETKTRLNKLRIPPAWQEVQISSQDNSHIQAVGLDKKGRKQYIYHPNWVDLMQQNKFDKMVFFGEVLPHIRYKISSDMNQATLKRERVIATIVWLLEHTLIRIGNEEYAKENKSYGLTTLHNKHVEVEGNKVTFEFKGKSGIYHSISISNRRVAKVIRTCQELPEQELFQYMDDDGERKIVSSDDVNNYVGAITGEDITAKDFRTWGGTVYAGNSLNAKGLFETETEMKKNIVTTIKEVAKHLGNTPAVCRTYYVHPTVIRSYEKKKLIKHFEEVLKADVKAKLHPREYAIWTLIKE